jgi:predicted cupin superfamily sugar epimerase
MNTASYWIRKLGLKKHPEGGYYREVYRSDETIARAALPGRYSGKRAFSTSIYFLLDGTGVSTFHRLKSDELWHFYAGSSLTIHIISPKGKYSRIRLGPSRARQQVFQYTVKRNTWFGATVDNLKSYSLVGCTVAPGFDFADFQPATRKELLNLCPGKRTVINNLTTPED